MLTSLRSRFEADHGSANNWWLRSPRNNSNNVAYVNNNGNSNNNEYSNTCCARPDQPFIANDIRCAGSRKQWSTCSLPVRKGKGACFGSVRSLVALLGEFHSGNAFERAGR